MSLLQRAAIAAALAGLAVAANPTMAADAPQGAPITTIPEKLDKNCRGGRAKIYDECSDQWLVFEVAAKRAATENKVLLVSYGAEWCIWCHVFTKYIHGEKTRFEYTYGAPEAPEERYTSTMYEREKRDVSGEATALKDYVSRSFVIVHIESYYTNGDDVLKRTGAAPFAGTWIPFIFAVDRNGHYAAHLEHDIVQLRRDTDDWYRGYDRRKLMIELKKMRDAASP